MQSELQQLALSLIQDLESNHCLSSIEMQQIEKNILTDIKKGKRLATEEDVRVLKEGIEKSKRYVARLEDCHKRLDSFPEAVCKEHQWFIDQLDRCLASAEEDFMNENCDDFDMGVKLMEQYLQNRIKVNHETTNWLSSLFCFQQ